MKYLKVFVSILLIACGLSMWLVRPAYNFPALPVHGSTYTADESPYTIGDLARHCTHLRTSGYLLITGRIDMETITGDRQAFFQTADSDSRLFLEYDPGQQSVLQFGIANSDESVQLIKLGNIKRTGSFLFAFIMTNDGTIDLWVAGAAIQTRNIVPLIVRASNPLISCNNVRLNAANGLERSDGVVKISISGGNSVSSGMQDFKDLQNTYESSLPNNNYQWPLYLGVALLFLKFPIRKFLKTIQTI
jgi:hypothetical protein